VIPQAAPQQRVEFDKNVIAINARYYRTCTMFTDRSELSSERAEREPSLRERELERERA
jgi:hypothetical protein